MDLPAALIVAYVAVFGSLSAWLAGERGRDPAPWFLLGALIGPFGAIIVGLAPRRIGAMFKACIECQEPILTAATTCPFCRTDLITAEGAEARRSRTSPSDREDPS
jgi:hypothetical protein